MFLWTLQPWERLTDSGAEASAQGREEQGGDGQLCAEPPKTVQALRNMLTSLWDCQANDQDSQKLEFIMKLLERIAENYSAMAKTARGKTQTLENQAS